ncbi:aromatic amino acid lyase [Aureimonas sp. Leaf454]|uniref:aromatic amino acid lyase n=1 Tax=Aureimonas sp. Leaf454 TaxID=1736381 RepID=UPI0007000671|nr:aromatic amino acid lyase [Aureimonas sp. Leaf454]
MRDLALGAGPIDLAGLVRAGAAGTRLRLAPGTADRLAASRRVVDRYADGNEPVYGLNTGLGGNLRHRLRPEEIATFQTGMVRGRTIGIGEPFDEATCRLIFLARIVGLTSGGAGLGSETVEAILAIWNAGLTPVVPRRGSIGAGDLGLAAHIASALLGLGQFYRDGRPRPAAEALAEAGLQPIALGAKDGLGLLNCSSVAAGHAASVLADLSDVLLLSAATAALSFEAYAANPRIFDERLSAARPARGQVEAASLFRAILLGSGLHAPGAARSIQDALSFRTIAPVFGAMLASMATAIADVETEINGRPDNPLVLVDDGLILSTANFHTPVVALAFDTLAIAGASLATASAYRTTKLMNADLSGLPKYLSPVGGASNGLNSLQKTAAALHAEIRLKATPASLDALPVSEGVEDHAPQTPLAVAKFGEQVTLLRMLAAVEALAAAQAADLRGSRSASVTGLLLSAIREHVPKLDVDREPGFDVDRLVTLFEDPALPDALRSALVPAGPAVLGPLALSGRG